MTHEELDEKIPWACDPIWATAEICPGWYRLVSDLVNDLNKMDCKYTVGQVKEKFGGLRFYVDIEHADGCPGDEKWFDCPIGKRISVAEAESYHVCEMCGGKADSKKAQGGFNYPVATLCERCRD